MIGLVSSYDAFLSQLLRVVLSKHPEIVLTSEKTVKFSELATFDSIESVRISIIDREIESVLRTSHHDQFDWMEQNFKIKLRENLPAWHRFIEVCERRNLLTHSGGIVSKQYIDTCKRHKCNIESVIVGQKLTVNPEYFRAAVTTIYEVGIKLCYVLWHKFETLETEQADNRLNYLGYDLIYRRSYDIAETLLSFGAEVVKTYKGNESTRRMMIVNLANAMRLQERKGDAERLLDKEDWSACSDEFKVCVAAVKGNIPDVIRMMRAIGASSRPTMEAYRTWPVFRGIRTDERFIAAFEELFGEPLIAVSPQVQQPPAAELPSPTRH